MAMSAAKALEARELKGDLTIKLGRRLIQLTHLDKIYWPDDGYTKGDLLRYYFKVSKYILPYLRDRPLILKRYPDGIEGESFHQHDVDEAPEDLRLVSIEMGDGHKVDYLVGGDLATLLYTANLGAIECHPWHSRIDNLDRPDWIVFDLDPGEGATFDRVCEVALKVRDLLESVGLASYAKTSGSRGIHVFVPLRAEHDYDQAARFAARIASAVARENPAIATVERTLQRRRAGQIYVDHLQNARGKSIVAPYSVRPRPGATVSTPLEWQEVIDRKIGPQDFTIETVLQRISEKGDPFKPVLRQKQRLRQAIKKIGSM